MLLEWLWMDAKLGKGCHRDKAVAADLSYNPLPVQQPILQCSKILVVSQDQPPVQQPAQEGSLESDVTQLH